MRLTSRSSSSQARLAGVVIGLGALAVAGIAPDCFSWVADPATNTLLDTAYVGIHDDRQIAEDGVGGGFIMVVPSSANGKAVQLLRFGTDGLLAPGWTQVGVTWVPPAPYMDFPRLTALGTGRTGLLYGSYSDFSNNDQLFFQEFDGLGAPLWPGSGVALTAGSTVRQAPPMIVAPDGSGGAFICWGDIRGAANSTDFPLYLTRVRSDGSLPWGAGGILIRKTGNYLTATSLLADNLGGAFITWVDSRPSPFGGAFAQHVDSTGAFVWPSSGATIQTSSPIVFEAPGPGIGLDDNGGIFVTGVRGWVDNLNRERLSARLNHLLQSGSRDPAWPDSGLGFGGPSATTENTDPRLFPCAGGDFLMVWSGEGNAARVGRDGTIRWRYSGDLPMSGGLPSWVSDLHGGVFWCFTMGQYASGLPVQTVDIYAHHLSADGVLLSGTGIPVSVAVGAQFDFQTITDSAGGMIACWKDSRQDPTQYSGPGRIFGQNINHDGTLGGSVVAAAVALVSFDASPSSVRLHWSVPSLMPVYRLERRESNGVWEVSATAQLSVTGADEVDVIDTDVLPAHTYDYRLSWDASGQTQHSVLATVRVPSELGLRLAVLGQPRSDGRAVIAFTLPADGAVRLNLYDVSGRLVRALLSGSSTGGTHAINWDGRDDSGRVAPSGVYVAQLDAGAKVLTTRVLVVK